MARKTQREMILEAVKDVTGLDERGFLEEAMARAIERGDRATVEQARCALERMDRMTPVKSRRKAGKAGDPNG